MHIAASVAIARDLIPALERLHDDLAAKAKEWDKIVKIGRTHLMDATPIRVGQVFSGYAAQAQYAVVRASRALKRLEENMPIGGTAVGTGINTHPRVRRQGLRRALATNSAAHSPKPPIIPRPRRPRIRSSKPTAS